MEVVKVDKALNPSGTVILLFSQYSDNFFSIMKANNIIYLESKVSSIASHVI